MLIPPGVCIGQHATAVKQSHDDSFMRYIATIGIGIAEELRLINELIGFRRTHLWAEFGSGASAVDPLPTVADDNGAFLKLQPVDEFDRALEPNINIHRLNDAPELPFIDAPVIAE